jgi:hypothetical protein
MRRIAPGLPVGRGARRRGAFDALDGQAEVLHPRRKHIAKDAPGFLDIEFHGRLFVLHEGWFLAATGIVKCIWWKWTLAARLEKA